MKQTRHNDSIVNIETEMKDEEVRFTLYTQEDSEIGKVAVREYLSEHFLTMELEVLEENNDLSEDESMVFLDIEERLKDKNYAYELNWLRVNDEFIGEGYARVLMNLALAEIRDREEEAIVYLNACPFSALGGLGLCELEDFYTRSGFESFYEDEGNIMMIVQDLGDMKIKEMEFIELGVVEQARIRNAKAREQNRSKSEEIYLTPLAKAV